MKQQRRGLSEVWSEDQAADHRPDKLPDGEHCGDEKDETHEENNHACALNVGDER
jgi:hypothetical protein